MIKKTDESIAMIVSASIRRSSMNYGSWQHTKFWSHLVPPVQQLLNDQCSFEVDELPILAVMFDERNWSVFSSRFIHYSFDGAKSQVSVREIEDLALGDFKGYRHAIDFLRIQGKDGAIHRIIYETGKASMGAVYAARTLKQVCSSES
jgi:hypothetical protein